MDEGDELEAKNDEGIDILGREDFEEFEEEGVGFDEVKEANVEEREKGDGEEGLDEIEGPLWMRRVEEVMENIEGFPEITLEIELAVVPFLEEIEADDVVDGEDEFDCFLACCDATEMIFERGSVPDIKGDVVDEFGDDDVVVVVVGEGEAVSLMRCWFDFERDSLIWIVFLLLVLFGVTSASFSVRFLVSSSGEIFCRLFMIEDAVVGVVEKDDDDDDEDGGARDLMLLDNEEEEDDDDGGR